MNWTQDALAFALGGAGWAEVAMPALPAGLDRANFPSADGDRVLVVYSGDAAGDDTVRVMDWTAAGWSGIRDFSPFETGYPDSAVIGGAAVGGDLVALFVELPTGDETWVYELTVDGATLIAQGATPMPGSAHEWGPVFAFAGDDVFVGYGSVRSNYSSSSVYIVDAAAGTVQGVVSPNPYDDFGLNLQTIDQDTVLVNSRRGAHRLLRSGGTWVLEPAPEIAGDDTYVILAPERGLTALSDTPYGNAFSELRVDNADGEQIGFYDAIYPYFMHPPWQFNGEVLAFEVGALIELLPVDADADTVGDDLDNCPDTANPGQQDADGDGIGDACDGTPPGC